MVSKALTLLAAVVAGAGAASTDYNANAVCAFNQLMRWYDKDLGLFLYPDGSYYWWQAGNMITAVADLARLDANVKNNVSWVWDNTWQKGGQSTHGIMKPSGASQKKVAVRGERAERRGLGVEKRDSKGFTANALDDEGWWAMAWIDVFDLTGNQDYLDTAIAIWQDMNGVYGYLNCGGVPWQHTEIKDDNPLAIPNELYIAISASLANRVSADQKATYLNAAQTNWEWFQKVGFINSDNLINDAVDKSTCTNQGNQPIWTYNQGVILGGLVELSKATGDASYLDRAATLADAATTKMVDGNGILVDTCDTAHNCSGDNMQFKGVFARNLRRLYEARPTAAWKAFLETNAQGIWNNDLSIENGDVCFIGPDWNGPYSDANASSQSSALDCLIAALYVSQN